MCKINNIYEPSRLAVVWQAPDGQERTRRRVAELVHTDDDVIFRYLTGDADFRLARTQGFTCYPAFRKTDREYGGQAHLSFMRRLPPRSRGDFAKYLSQWCLTSDIPISDFALLGYTGAKLPTDGFSLTPTLEDIAAPVEFLMEVAGFRYQGVERSELVLEMPVTFKNELDNPADTKAIAVYAGDSRIGYVNRLQAVGFGRLLERYVVHAHIERINGTEERPIIYLFVEIKDPH
jgi:hypothetical protein